MAKAMFREWDTSGDGSLSHSELKRSIKMKMAEGTVHEELEHERATSRDLQRLEEERRAASVAAAEAGVQLRQAQDTSREMQAKIAKYHS